MTVNLIIGGFQLTRGLFQHPARPEPIAKIIGCAPKTLRKRLRDELDLGVAEANATVSGYLFAAAKAGNIAAIIFWLKTRAHWRESTPTQGARQNPGGDLACGAGGGPAH